MKHTPKLRQTYCMAIIAMNMIFNTNWTNKYYLPAFVFFALLLCKGRNLFTNLSVYKFLNVNLLSKCNKIKRNICEMIYFSNFSAKHLCNSVQSFLVFTIYFYTKRSNYIVRKYFQQPDHNLLLTGCSELTFHRVSIYFYNFG